MSAAVIKKPEFETEVLKSEVPVLVDFFATWCGPCQRLAPILEQVEPEYEGKINFFKVDIDEEPDLANSYNVRSVPTLILFKGGQPVKVSVGLMPADDVRDFLSEE